MTTSSPHHLLARLPIPHRIAGFALAATLFVLVLLGLAHHNFRGEILGDGTAAASPSPSGGSTPRLPSSPSSPLRSRFYVAGQPREDGAYVASAGAGDADDEPYYVFLQKFPLENSWKMLFHTEVVVCPRSTFSSDAAFLNLLDGLVPTIEPSRFAGDGELSAEDAAKSPFVAIEEASWSKQSNPGCVQLGYGGANCGSGCCGSPHRRNNRNYALNARAAVIGNAMTEDKELYLYGVSGSAGVAGISGDDAYKAVCHGHMNAIEMGGLPRCVSDWAGRSYNPLTNNCNTFTSTVLKCVYGLSDAKPGLGVSDMRTVSCPAEETGEGKEAEKCAVPAMDGTVFGGDVDEGALLE